MINVPFAPSRPVNRYDAAMTAAVALSFVAAYAGVLVSLVRHWSTNDMYAHGYLIPVISGYLLWEKRAELARTPVEHDPFLGAIVLGLGLAMQIAGALGGVLSIEQLSLVVALCGVVLCLFGRAMLRQTIFPLLFLVFMIPIWEILTNRLHTPFQVLSAQIGAGLLRLFGVPIRLEGVFLELPNITLEVAQACSGVNFLIAILALALPQAYLMLQSATLRVLVAIWAVIVALLTNGLRVAVIGAVAYSGLSGPDIHGPGHVLQGLFVAVFGFIVLFLTILWLARRYPRVAAHDGAPEAVDAAGVSGGHRLNARVAYGVAVLLLLTTIFGITPRAMPVEPGMSLASFPTSLGPWFATIADVRASGFRTDGADVELARTYLGPGGAPMSLYVAYFTSQTQGRELVTERTLAFEGLATRIAIDVPGGTAIEANQFVRRTKSGEEYMVFWYDLNRHTTASGYTAKMWTTWDAFARSRSNGALVMVTSLVPQGGNRAAVETATRAFAGTVARELDGYVSQ